MIWLTIPIAWIFVGVIVANYRWSRWWGIPFPVLVLLWPLTFGRSQ